VTLFFVNAILFLMATVFARIILREVAKSGRLVTTFALVFTNAVILFFTSVMVLLILTVLAVPLFWLLVPYFYLLAHHSMGTVLVYLLGGALSLFFEVGSSTKVVLLITFMPGSLALVVGLISLFAIKWPKAFYFLVKNVVIRCAEKNPFVVLGVTVSFICALVTLLADFVHFLGFV
jgi:hypothetical protein